MMICTLRMIENDYNLVNLPIVVIVKEWSKLVYEANY